jgi:hypothetical protein
MVIRIGSLGPWGKDFGEITPEAASKRAGSIHKSGSHASAMNPIALPINCLGYRKGSPGLAAKLG